MACTISLINEAIIMIVHALNQFKCRIWYCWSNILFAKFDNWGHDIHAHNFCGTDTGFVQRNQSPAYPAAKIEDFGCTIKAHMTAQHINTGIADLLGV